MPDRISPARPNVRTQGPIAFCKQVDHALDDLRCGRVTAMSAVYDPTGIGRVSVTTIDGQNVDLEMLGDDEPTGETEPGSPAAKRRKRK